MGNTYFFLARRIRHTSCPLRSTYANFRTMSEESAEFISDKVSTLPVNEDIFCLVLVNGMSAIDLTCEKVTSLCPLIACRLLQNQLSTARAVYCKVADWWPNSIHHWLQHTFIHVEFSYITICPYHCVLSSGHSPVSAVYMTETTSPIVDDIYHPSE